MKTAGLLKPTTDPLELARRSWIDLDGVTDDWLKGLKIEKVANGGRPKLLYTIPTCRPWSSFASQ